MVQPLIRVVLPVLISLLLLLAGGAFVTLIASPAEGATVWAWPIALFTFLLLGWLFRSRLSHWVSPGVFLIASVPVLVLLLALTILIPYGPETRSVMAEELNPTSKPLDLAGSLLTVEGRETSLEDIDGKVLFLNFWATWCGPCRQEMPSMDDLYHQLSSQGLSMVAISDEDPATVQRYLEDQPYSFKILLDPDGALFSRLKIRALPTTLVLDKDRKLVLEHMGGYQWNTPELVEKFRKMLAD